MRSVGLDLRPCLSRGTLRVIASRPTVHGLEQHLVAIHKQVSELKPAVVVLDPITNMISVGTVTESRSMLTRLIDFLKVKGVTTFFTSLTIGGKALEETDLGISSLIDTWLMLAMVRSEGERNRTLAIIKSRGMAHSNQAVEYRFSSRGLELVDTYLGMSGVLTGTARLVKEAEDRAVLDGYRDDLELRERERERRRRGAEAQVTALREELAAEVAQIDRGIQDVTRRRERLLHERQVMARSRKAFAPSLAGKRPKEDPRS